MNKIFKLLMLFTLTFLFSTITSHAQNQTELWGMLSLGGNGGGAIFKTDGNGNNQHIIKTFIDNPGAYPNYCDLCKASNGKLYGLTAYGGAADYGVLFEYDPTTSIFTKKIDFDGSTNGSYPNGSLIEASNGKLYGMTYRGGTNGDGVLFEYDPAASTYIKKFDFNGTNNGSHPYGSLIQADNGKLYGMTRKGGANDTGVLFEFDPITLVYVKRHDFSITSDGGGPYGSLIQASNGRLYGVTSLGGANGHGVLFEYDLAASTYTKKLDFDGINNGSHPEGSLVQATNGKLYGMTKEGGANSMGVLFEYDIATSTYTKNLDFAGNANGSFPRGKLMQATNGKLYGMTRNGGANNLGVLFEYDPTSSTYIKKLDFDGITHGQLPDGGLMQADNGNLYGVTSKGGACDFGVLFEYNVTTSTYTRKLSFTDAIDGSNPWGSLVQASNGKLYGMTYEGGASNLGVLFEFDPITLTYTKKIDFDGSTNGSYPKGSLIEASNGKLYGLTCRGGTSDCGVLFEFDPATSTYTKKFDFTTSSYGGYYPNGSLIEAGSGKLYGMTHDGGICNKGVLFEYNFITSTYTKMLEFAGTTTGSYPEGSLVQASNGMLYGITNRGGIHDMGALFEFDPSNSAFTKWIDFECTTYGSFPHGSLMYAANGKLYGMTYDGGAHSKGLMFEFDPTTTTYTIKLDFDGATNGSYSFGSMMQASNGKLYGLTYEGGASDYGVLFEYDLATSICTKKLDFDGLNGKNPFYTNLIEICKVYSVIETYEICNGQSYVWHGQTLSSSGTYFDNQINVYGCDSVHVLYLTVDAVDIGLTLTDPTTITVDSIADAYQWLDCDNVFIPIAGATLQSYTATSNGNYAVIITQGSCSDTSACIPITTVDIASEYLSGFALYPNPSNGQFTIELDENANVEIFNVLGEFLYTASLNKGKHILSLNLVDGVYLLKIVTVKGFFNSRIIIQE